MNKEEDYASSDSESDEDFCPEKAGAAAEAVSEVDTDDEEGEEDETEKKRPSKGRKKTLNKKRTKKQEDSDDDDDDDEEEQHEQKNGKAEAPRRSTRQTEGVSNGHGKATQEKDKLESDDDEKSRTDALWADFMSDVKPATSKKPATTVSKPETATPTRKPAPATTADKTEITKKVELAEAAAAAPKPITITEIVEFAGEEVRVQKTVNADSIKENKAAATTPKASSSIGMRPSPVGLKRPAASGSGLGSLLNQIGKKKKISVLEKTQLDWKSFKQDEGIEEQLQTFNKGKDGYLERQDFLQRTDLRQFEIEKNMRQTRRK